MAFHRLNTDLLAKALISFDPINGHFSVSESGQIVDFSNVRAAYFRRPEAPVIPGGGDGDTSYIASEWNALLKSLYLLVGNRWFSHPRDILVAEDKPGQLHLANNLGFEVPETLITNDLEAAQKFLATSEAIGKPLRQALIEINGEERVIFTSLVERFEVEDREPLKRAPIILQRHIPKRYDIRVTVVGARTFPVAIHSQSEVDTAIDWRKGSSTALPHEPITLPSNVNAACVEFVRRQNLRFGAIDLVLDRDGKYWFLECNPNGQWAWIENRTGMQIAGAIVDELQGIAAL